MTTSPLQREATLEPCFANVEEQGRELEKCFGITLQFVWDWP
jgi:hypothetical protein